jgi:hypothetical protein
MPTNNQPLPPTPPLSGTSSTFDLALPWSDKTVRATRDDDGTLWLSVADLCERLLTSRSNAARVLRDHEEVRREVSLAGERGERTHTFVCGAGAVHLIIAARKTMPRSARVALYGAMAKGVEAMLAPPPSAKPAAPPLDDADIDAWG